MYQRGPWRCLGAVCLIVCSGTAHAGTKLPADLRAAAAAFDAAQLDGDGAALDRMLADDYALLNGDGSEENRTGFIRDYTQTGFHLDPFVVRQSLVRVWSGGAVMSGLARLAGVSGGARFDRCIRFTDVWSFRKGQWKVAFTHVSKPPENACGDTIR